MVKPADETLHDAVRAFGSNEPNISIQPLGRGNINDTYLVHGSSRKYVLQRINSSVFPKPFEVALNFESITSHIAHASAASGTPFTCPQLLLTTAGEVAYSDRRGEWWRAQSYIEHVPSRQLDFNQGNAAQLGCVLAAFHSLTVDIDTEKLFAPLPGFHITPCYLAQFDRVFMKWQGPESADLTWCFECVDRFRSVSDVLEEAKANDRLHLRTIHGDPKLDNIIFNNDGKAVGLFDLDTIGPGLIHYDLGDCLRSCCNRAGECTDSPEEVRFDLDICESVLAGYLEIAGNMLSRWDRYYIYDAILVITFELGLRFLTDHLAGNIYFKVTDPEQNLARALVQFHLAESVSCQERDIRTLSGC